MKKIFILLISAMFILSACNSNTKQHDFFDVDFGMTADELLEIRSVEPDWNTDTPQFWFYGYNNQEFLGMSNASLWYFVDEDGICRAAAIFPRAFDDDASYQSGYNSLKEILISEWGEPIKTIENDADFKYWCSWGNKFLELYKDEVEGDIIVTFQVTAYRPDYLEENAWQTEIWATE